jgi:hypothetical protein
MRGVLLALALAPALLGGCAGLSNGTFSKGALRYAIAAPDLRSWHRVQLTENDLAWTSVDSGEVIAVNSTCDDHGDPSLEILTNHLLFGFSEHELLERRTEILDGREALRSRYQAKLDGVPVELELLVLKKNRCVHDFTFISPLSDGAGHRAAFDTLVSSFRQEAAP